MAYNKEQILQRCLEVIEKEKITFFCDLILYIDPSLSTLYEWELEKSEDIKNAITKNKLASKKKMRLKWEDSENPALQLAAYKLIAEKDELNSLTMNRQEIANPPGESFDITLNLK